MKVKPTVLKLGGSVITDKNKPATANLKAIERLADEISQAKVSSLILVHGGGSFGHPIAKKYKLAEGYEKPAQMFGFSETHRAMTQLNGLVMEALLSHDVNAVVVAPSSCVVTKAGRIQSIELKPIKRMLDMGLVPVLYVISGLTNGLALIVLVSLNQNAEKLITAGNYLIMALVVYVILLGIYLWSATYGSAAARDSV